MNMVMDRVYGTRRRLRSPEHDFHLRHRAYTIQPFMFHPVRPGETLKNVLWQSRVVSDPLANPLMGWHLEYYYFYVQLQDAVPVGQEDTYLKYLWDPADTAVAHWGALQTRLECGSLASANFPGRYIQNVSTDYRGVLPRGGEVWNSAHKMSGVLALARRNRKDAFESSTTEFGTPVDVTINIADGLTVQELRDAMSDYMMLMDTSMGSVTTFEDYLASQGQGSFSDIKRAYRPELVRVVKEWTYPVNTVDPISGTPSSAVSWAVQQRADKDRYFKEPGYLIGLTVARPKTLRPINDDLADRFNTYEHWLPKQAMHNPSSGLNSAGWFTNDLFEYGFQFVNFDAAAGAYNANQINWALVDGGVDNSRGVYPVEASINTKVWKAAASNNVRQDGRVQLNILTDLPKDGVVGATANQEPSAASDVDELANEYLSKLKERREGKQVNLPNIRATLEKLVEEQKAAS